MRKLAKVLAAMAAVSGAGMPEAGAATVSRDALERQMLDACIYRQYAVKDINRTTMVDKCRCAVRSAMTGFSGDSFDLTRSGGLTGQQDTAVRAGIEACFKR